MTGNYSSSHSKAQFNPSEVLGMYNQGLPSALGTTFGQAPAAANALAQSAAGANPVYTQSGLNQLNQYLPGYIGAGGAAANQQATNTSNLIGGAGGQAAIGAENLNRQINPEFYNTRSTLSDQTSKLFNSIGGAQLSPAEMAATERSVNQGNAATGNSGQFNPWNTVNNAMNFGQALRQKQALIGNTISQTTPLLGAVQNTNNTAGNFAVNSGNVGQNFGATQFNPTQANANLTSPIQFGQSVFGTLGQIGATPYQTSKNTGAGVADCCFIFMESYNGDMPFCVRKCRDRYYRHNPQIASGYKKMAKWLVPMMQHFVIVRKLVWKYMVFPLTQYGRFVTRQDPNGKDYKSYRKFWFTIWNILGK